MGCRRVAASWLFALVASAPAVAGDIPEALLVLEVSSPDAPGAAPEGAPPRFVLLEDGQAFVGGTSHVASVRLERAAVKEIEKQISRVRRLTSLGNPVTLGPGATHYRFLLRKGRPLEIAASGDPAVAPPAVKPLATLLAQLAGFNHPGLRPYKPALYALKAREGSLAGGCRSWSFPVPLAECLSSARPVPAEAARGWPTGATPASVCSGDKTYVVTLRPLLPGEKP